jgi:hypothetical protein
MAECLVCGKKAGALREICLDCEGQGNAEQRAARDQAILEERAARDQAILDQRAAAAQISAQWESSFVEGISQGSTAFAYQTVYVPIDSVVNNEAIAGFDISGVQKLGLFGWKIVGIMPRTIGVGLTNISYGSSSGETWGAGLGGNVAGVYVLLSKEVAAGDQDSVEEALEIGRGLIADGVAL